MLRQARVMKMEAGLTATWDKTPRLAYLLPKRVAVPNADGRAFRPSYSMWTTTRSRLCDPSRGWTLSCQPTRQI
jgi:hypothetical protein